MRYIKKTGYDAIVALESEKCLLAEREKFAEVGEKSAVLQFFCGGIQKEVSAAPGKTLREILEEAAIPAEDVKAVHIGYPIGGLFTADVLDQPLNDELLEKDSLCAGSLEIHILNKNVCIVDYMLHLTKEIQADSCGRCVYCREGLRQIYRITQDITQGKQLPDDMDLLNTLSDALILGGHCLYGRSVGHLWKTVLRRFGDEFEAHIRRKRCDALVCKKYFTYHILPTQCDGCTECLDVCPNEAIAGKKRYIHVIDSFECDRCGACAEVCPKNAIVKAGAIKPRTPEDPIPVGKWRGR